MAKARQLPSGSWRVQISTGEKNENGKYIYTSFTFPTKKEAEFAALEFQVKHKEIMKSPSNLTLLEAMKLYIDTKDNVLSPSTIRLYTQIKNSYLKNIINIKLNQLNKYNIQSAINDEASAHSPKTVKNIYGLLTAVLKIYNPILYSQLNITLPQRQKKEMKILTPEQTAILIKSVEGKAIELPILFATWLGMRLSEICGLKWENIDFENNTLIINQVKIVDKNYKYVIKSTAKTASSNRKFKIPEFIMLKIKSTPRKNDFVISIRVSNVYEGFKRALKKNKLPDVRFHDLRHFNASVMLQLNIPDKYAMERGGWSTNYTMKNVYQHTFTKERETVDNLINNYFENLLKIT